MLEQYLFNIVDNVWEQHFNNVKYILWTICWQCFKYISTISAIFAKFPPDFGGAAPETEWHTVVYCSDPTHPLSCLQVCQTHEVARPLSRAGTQGWQRQEGGAAAGSSRPGGGGKNCHDAGGDESSCCGREDVGCCWEPLHGAGCYGRWNRRRRVWSAAGSRPTVGSGTRSPAMTQASHQSLGSLRTSANSPT